MTPQKETKREPRIYPELSDVIPVRCETCRFWTEHVGNEKPWGYCGLIGSGSRDKAAAYLTGEFATEMLHTLPHFSCAHWAKPLEDAECKNCNLPIFFNGGVPAWQHKGTQYAACSIPVTDKTKWAEPKVEP